MLGGPTVSGCREAPVPLLFGALRRMLAVAEGIVHHFSKGSIAAMVTLWIKPAVPLKWSTDMTPIFGSSKPEFFEPVRRPVAQPDENGGQLGGQSPKSRWERCDRKMLALHSVALVTTARRRRWLDSWRPVTPMSAVRTASPR